MTQSETQHAPHTGSVGGSSTSPLFWSALVLCSISGKTGWGIAQLAGAGKNGAGRWPGAKLPTDNRHRIPITNCWLQGVYLTLLEIALALRHLHSRRLVHRGTAVYGGAAVCVFMGSQTRRRSVNIERHNIDRGRNRVCFDSA